jgi:hypothetical protein
MTPPKRSSIAAVVVTVVLGVAVYAAREIFPPLRLMGNSQLSSLREEQSRLAAYSEGATRMADAQLAAIRRDLWTSETFKFWRQQSVPDTWVIQDLGPTDLKHIHGRRYAFQRPQATDKDWPEIVAVLGSLEGAHCVSVQSAALSVHPGYAASRQFSQCLIIAVFYFTGDDGPPSHLPPSA